MEQDRVVIAELVRPRGNRGEILAISQTDVPGRLQSLTTAQVTLADGSDLPVKVEAAWQHKADWILKFAGVDSIADADRFRGANIWVPLEQRATLPEGEFFRSDLLGCTLIDRQTGQVLGKVEGWLDLGASQLLETVIGGREVLIPFAPEICREIDLASGLIRVELPAGLLEL